MSKCPLRAGYCDEHGFIHGAEAEELRKGVERLIERDPDDWPQALHALLDKVDARDSLAFLEATDGEDDDEDIQEQPTTALGQA